MGPHGTASTRIVRATALDPSPWDGNPEAYREDLYAGMAFGMRDVRAFAREWLEELLRVGYYGMGESLGLPLKQRSNDFFAPPKPLPLWGEAYPTRLAETGQTIWIRLDGLRSPERGYREISVSDEPLRTDAAIVAALTGNFRGTGFSEARTSFRRMASCLAVERVSPL